jgi:Spy/CpxP family protein refolding chaperone
MIRGALVAGLLVATAGSVIAAQQGPPGQRGRGQGMPEAGPGVPVQQLQSMFDAYVLVQAQRALELTDEQYQRFFTRMSRLQELRRQHLQQRMRRLNELRRVWRLASSDEAILAQQTKALDDFEAKYEIDLKAARQAIDEVLTPRQRAGFRFFEEDMDRRKLEFLTQARQGRQGGGG